MGFRNPNLRTVLDIDPARAQRNALLIQQGQQLNQLRGQQIAQAPEERNYLLQQRENAATDRQGGIARQGVQDARASETFLRQAVPTFGHLAT